MSTAIEIRLSKLTINNNGVSQHNLAKASNILEAFFYHPNTKDPAVQTLKSLNLSSNEEYMSHALDKYEKKLKDRHPPLNANEIDRLLAIFNKKLEIDSTLFKLQIEGTSVLEINLSVAEENKRLEDIIGNTFKTAVKIVSGSIPVIGTVLSGLMSPSLDSLFSPSAGNRLHSIGKAYFEIDESTSGFKESDLIVTQDLNVMPIKAWKFPEPGIAGEAQITELEPGIKIGAGNKNGSVGLDIRII